MLRRKIGFSHGVTYKIHDPYSRENIDLFISCGCTAIEVNCHTIDDVDKLDSLLPYISGFEYVSLHMPCYYRYKNDRKTLELLHKISIIYHKIGARLAVLHPVLIEDMSIFENFTSINWAIENMDGRGPDYNGVDDLMGFFATYPNWGFVLDVGHCNVNDKTMALADDLIVSLKGKIREIHLSGYESFHDPLYRTKQIEIIDRCKDLAVPIIIESTFEKTEGLFGVAQEFLYIMENLK